MILLKLSLVEFTQIKHPLVLKLYNWKSGSKSDSSNDNAAPPPVIGAGWSHGLMTYWVCNLPIINRYKI